MPGQDRVRLDDRGDLTEDPAAQLLAEVSECFAFAVGQLESAPELCAQDSVFFKQLLIPEQELFVHRARAVRQKLFQPMVSTTLVIVLVMMAGLVRPFQGCGGAEVARLAVVRVF